MVTRLKNSFKARATLITVIILVLSIITVGFFPIISNKAEKDLQDNISGPDVVILDNEVVSLMYKACFVLNLEKKNSKAHEDAVYKPSRLYFMESEMDDNGSVNLYDMKQVINDAVNEWSEAFYNNASYLDFCYEAENNEYVKNTNRELEKLKTDEKTKDELLLQYSIIIELNFDENGNMKVKPITLADGLKEDSIIKSFIALDKTVLNSLLEEYFGGTYFKDYIVNPQNFNVIFGIPKDMDNNVLIYKYRQGRSYYSEYYEAYRQHGGFVLYGIMLVIIAMIMLIATSQWIWKVRGEDGIVTRGSIVSMSNSGRWYLAEMAWIGVIIIIAMDDIFFDLVRGFANSRILSLSEKIGLVSMSLSVVFLVYIGWYLSLRFIRPLFTIGIKEYIKQYSLTYIICFWIKSKFVKLKYELTHLDFEKNTRKTIVEVLIVNYVILAIISFFWVGSFFILAVYSLILYIFIGKYYKKIQKDYNALLTGVKQIAEGNLTTQITEDIGIFNPIKEELEHVREGFKAAVDEEVKSQRMKAELITNVSHDLKTPLTAITTYVELLKNDKITEEERASYIDTLDRKSQKLKVLIEDVVEISKATTNNIVLQKTDVDVINLIKQVSIEHTDRFNEKGLELRWNVPMDEKIILNLDPQKTYRIFENLFVNIQKYAMENSRVYIETEKTVEKTQICIKNISATELNINPQELTERFVRGDMSRNTEGSGLGLAIAKSFTEAQDGTLDILIDGDLFKVIICF